MTSSRLATFVPPSVGLTILSFAASLGVSDDLVAQTFVGRVLDERSEQPVATALVRLVDTEGEGRAVAIADSAGFYRLAAPEPGVYRLEAARLGYENFETPMLDAGQADGEYPIDLLLRAEPVELPGFTVETNRVPDEQADREVRLMIGLSVSSLRFRPIDFDQIQDHLMRSHSLVDVMRWSNNSGLIVSRDADGPCFSLRARGCLPVYLNGMPLYKDFVEGTPLDMVYRIVVVTPGDGSIVYPSGAVLLYTEAWLR